MLRRLFCLSSALAVLFFVSVPAFATGVMPGGGLAGLPVGVEIQLDVVDFANFVRDDFRWCENTVRHWLDEDVCPYAPTSGGGHSFVPRRTMVDGQIGKYYVCEYCGKAYGDALEEAYNEYVSDTYGSFTRYDGSGNIPVSLFINGHTGAPYDGGWPSSVKADYSPGEVAFSTSGASIHFYKDSRTRPYLTCSFVVSLSGTLVVPSGTPYTVTSFSNSSFNFSGTFGGATRGVSAGDTVSLSFDANLGSTDSSEWTDVRVSYGSFGAYIVPTGALGTMYDTDTRVSGGNVSDSGTGSYGYVQDGQLYQSTVGTIYNETTNIYQNPVTGETGNVTNWTRYNNIKNDIKIDLTVIICYNKEKRNGRRTGYHE